MTRPQIIRADTIDLQSQSAPSAKDHTRQPTHPGPLGDGPPAPHQAIALRHAEQDIEYHTRSPRMSLDLSNKELQLLHEDSDSFDSTNLSETDYDFHNLQRKRESQTTVGDELDLEEAEGDEGLDDDTVDRISSSPSIEDGGYYSPLSWPERCDSLPPPYTIDEDAASASPSRDSPPPSPFLWSSKHFSLSYAPSSTLSDPNLDRNTSEDHHHRGEYAGDQGKLESKDLETFERTDTNPLLTASDLTAFPEESDNFRESDDADLNLNCLQHLLVPKDDPLLDNSFDDVPLSSTASSPSSTRSPSPSTDQLFDTDTISDNYDDDDDDDDSEDISFSDDSRFVDSGWGGECLREVEDIDFGFVYALHTFVATVEGQANATKGDTMVLLDDTNSYWWLVRIVKDTSIGYLPAEHIETPTERIARLNKHRNVDLSRSMLGDNPEKSKNPLKKAMHRRTKKVQFTAPTFVEAPEADYSTEEEENGEGEFVGQEEGADTRNVDQEKDLEDVGIASDLQSKDLGNELLTTGETQSLDTYNDDKSTLVEAEVPDDENPEKQDDATAGRSRKGTLRNTDSFFKDDTVETRKINLTPSLLRDDSSGIATKSGDGREIQLKSRGSLDSLEKVQSPPEKSKDDKKRKDKKGMLSGLFKRKDKRNRAQEDEIEEVDKASEETITESLQPKNSTDNLAQEFQAHKASSQSQPQRQTSKLQKAPPGKYPAKADPPLHQATITEQPSLVSALSDGPSTPISPSAGVAPKTQPEPERYQAKLDISSSQHISHNSTVKAPSRSESTKDSRRGMFSPVRDALLSSSPGSKPEKLKAAKQRMPLDEFDSSSDLEETPDATGKGQVPNLVTAPVKADEQYLSESPVEVVLQPDSSQPHQPPALVVDTSSQEDPSTSPVSPVSSAELIEAPQDVADREETPVSTAQSSSNMPTWSDASLRAYLDDDSDIRDLLVVVHDKSNVKPATPDHPLVKDLFKEENRKLGEISNQLDGLLGDWLARKARKAG